VAAVIRCPVGWPWTGVQEVEYSKVLVLLGGEELLLRAGVVWKEGLGHRT
jgi:hypothetical protein